jgi:hypothetical protein
VKGLGVSVFKDKEVAVVEEMGNENAWKIWLAKFRDIKGAYPNHKDILEVQEHLREKYVLKRYYKDVNKSCDTTNTSVKKPFSENNSVNHSNIFSETDFKFETKVPSTFKKHSSSTITSTLKIDNKTEIQDNDARNLPLTSRKTTENINWSNPIISSIPQPINTCRNTESKGFDFSKCNNSSFSNTSTNSTNSTNMTVTTSTSTNNAPTIAPMAPFTHDFTKSVKMMESLNNLYSGYDAEKKVDPLDKLFYQYNFSSGNNMRTNNHNNSAYQMNNQYNNQYTPQYNQYQYQVYNQQMYNNCKYGINPNMQ